MAIHELKLIDLQAHQGMSLKGHSTQSKNKLQEDVYNLLNSKSNILCVEYGDIVNLADEITDSIVALNLKYHKCKPVQASWRYRYDGSGISLSGTHVNFDIHFAGEYVKPDFDGDPY